MKNRDMNERRGKTQHQEVVETLWLYISISSSLAIHPLQLTYSLCSAIAVVKAHSVLQNDFFYRTLLLRDTPDKDVDIQTQNPAVQASCEKVSLHG